MEKNVFELAIWHWLPSGSHRGPLRGVYTRSVRIYTLTDHLRKMDGAPCGARSPLRSNTSAGTIDRPIRPRSNRKSDAPPAPAAESGKRPAPLGAVKEAARCERRNWRRLGLDNVRFESSPGLQGVDIAATESRFSF